MNRYYNKVFQLLFKAADLMLLNILWFLCSLPVITIGAETCALNSAAWKVIRDEESTLLKDFFSAFRKDFRQGTIAWLMFVLLIGLLAGDIAILLSFFSTSPVSLLWIPLALLLVLVCIAACYCFPLISRYEMPLKDIMKLSMALVNRKLLYSIPISVLTYGTLFAAFVSLPGSLFLCFLFAGSLVVFVCYPMLDRIFAELENRDRKEQAE